MIKPAKTCVYAIALNEIKHVDRFMDAAQDADLILVCDTGSTDGTPDRLRERGAVVYDILQSPWRFDLARNTALNLIPKDVDLCLSIDLDEELQPGWAESLEEAWQETNGTLNRANCDLVYTWDANGNPQNRLSPQRIHSRRNYVWRHPCHEALYWVGTNTEVSVKSTDISIHHRPDNNKSRGQYLDLLHQATVEDSNSARMCYYYARELYFRAQWDKAIQEFQRHLSLPQSKWNEERASSYRFISKCYRQLGNNKQSLAVALKGLGECDYTRDPWMEVAWAAFACQDWNTCYWAATKCLAINYRSGYASDGRCWNWEPYDHAAISAYYIGLYDSALALGQKALEVEPNNPRLMENLRFYQEKLSKDS
jgi:glycosyltransferase involved in cell wall biosynthesis